MGSNAYTIMSLEILRIRFAIRYRRDRKQHSNCTVQTNIMPTGWEEDRKEIKGRREEGRLK